MSGNGASYAKLKAYNDALIHSAGCKELFCPTHGAMCQQIKIHLSHFSTCKIKQQKAGIYDKCARCSKMCGLMKFHAFNCSMAIGEKCIVGPACDFLREYVRIRNATKGWRPCSQPTSPVSDPNSHGNCSGNAELAAQRSISPPPVALSRRSTTGPTFSSPTLETTSPKRSSPSCKLLNESVVKLNGVDSDGEGNGDASPSNHTSPTSVSETSSIGDDAGVSPSAEGRGGGEKPTLQIFNQGDDSSNPRGPLSGPGPGAFRSIIRSSSPTSSLPPSTLSGTIGNPAANSGGTPARAPSFSNKRFFPLPAARAPRGASVKRGSPVSGGWESQRGGVMKRPRSPPTNAAALLRLTAEEVRAALLEGGPERQRRRLAMVLGIDMGPILGEDERDVVLNRGVSAVAVSRAGDDVLLNSLPLPSAVDSEGGDVVNGIGVVTDDGSTSNNNNNSKTMLLPAPTRNDGDPTVVVVGGHATCSGAAVASGSPDAGDKMKFSHGIGCIRRLSSSSLSSSPSSLPPPPSTTLLLPSGNIAFSNKCS